LSNDFELKHVIAIQLDRMMTLVMKQRDNAFVNQTLPESIAINVKMATTDIRLVIVS
jgi:hypothetical protein